MLSWRVGFKSRINNVSVILHCKSQRPFARISKCSHLMFWLVAMEWLATAEAWPIRARALKCSVFLSCEHFKALTQIGHASTVADHSISTGHNIKWDHFEILANGHYRDPAKGWHRSKNAVRSCRFWTLHCEGYIADLLLGVLAGSMKSYPPFWKARGSFWGNDLYNALVYERKFKSEYLER